MTGIELLPHAFRSVPEAILAVLVVSSRPVEIDLNDNETWADLTIAVGLIADDLDPAILCEQETIDILELVRRSGSKIVFYASDDYWGHIYGQGSRLIVLEPEVADVYGPREESFDERKQRLIDERDRIVD